MFKKIFIGGLIITLILIAAAGIYSTTLAADSQTGSARYGGGAQSGRGNSAQESAGGGYRNSQTAEFQLPAYNVTADPKIPLESIEDVSQEEIDGILFMREEEKLARDVYLTMFNLWELPIFQNIAASEQNHMDAVMNLITIYGLEDPASNAIGVFTNPDLQNLYDQLVERGSKSLSEALMIGGAIEEIDIIDLQNQLAKLENSNIQQIYMNLLRGSENHLRSFVSAVQSQTGEIYHPQYLEQDVYQTILSTTRDTGRTVRGGYGARGSNQP